MTTHKGATRTRFTQRLIGYSKKTGKKGYFGGSHKDSLEIDIKVAKHNFPNYHKWQLEDV